MPREVPMRCPRGAHKVPEIDKKTVFLTEVEGGRGVPREVPRRCPGGAQSWKQQGKQVPREVPREVPGGGPLMLLIR